MLGTAIAVLVSLLPCCAWAGVGFGDGTAPAEGVAGMEMTPNSFSDGACDVAGVSNSDGAGRVDVSDARSSTPASWLSSSLASRAGSATEPISFKLCRLFRLLAARGGNLEAPSALEYHGKVGRKGARVTAGSERGLTVAEGRLASCS